MSNIKISQLEDLSTTTVDDIIPIVKISQGINNNIVSTSHKIDLENLFTTIPSDVVIKSGIKFTTRDLDSGAKLVDVGLMGNRDTLVLSSKNLQTDVNGANIELFNGDHSSAPYEARYDASEHVFRDYDVTPNDLMTITFDGTTQEPTVGIGTRSPDCHLHISTTGLQYTKLFNDNGNTVLKTRNGNNKGTFKIIQDDVDGSFTPFTIDDEGLVGIGTQNPNSILTIDCNNPPAGAQRGITFDRNHPISDGGIIGSFIWNNTANANTNDNNDIEIAKMRVSTETTDNNAHDDSGGHLEFHTKPEAGPLTKRMVIRSDGNVGIGPNGLSGDERLHVDGTVLVETTNPTIHLKNDNVTDNTTYAYTKIYNDGGGVTVFEAHDPGTATKKGIVDFRQWDGANFTTAWKLSSTGNMGVGTTSPTTKLDVNGDGNFTGDVTITGDLTVNGNTSTSSSTNSTLTDSLIGLNDGLTGANVNDSGIIIERGTSGDNAALVWDESEDEFLFGTTTDTTASTGDLTLTPVGVKASEFKIESGTQVNPIVLSDSGSGDMLKISNQFGYTMVGPGNASFSHFYTDRTRFYFDKKVVINEGIVSAYDDDLILTTGSSPTTSSTGVFIKNSTHEVGIGTNTPSERLEVSGNIKGSGTISTGAFTLPNSIGSAGQVLKVPSSGTILEWANDDNSGGGGSVRTVKVDTNGDGSVDATLDAAEDLTLKAGTNITLAESNGTVTINSTATTGASATTLVDADSDTKIQVEEGADEDIIRFDTGGSEKMVLNDTEATDGYLVISAVADTNEDNRLLRLKGTKPQLYFEDTDVNTTGRAYTRFRRANDLFELSQVSHDYSSSVTLTKIDLDDGGATKHHTYVGTSRIGMYDSTGLSLGGNDSAGYLLDLRRHATPGNTGNTLRIAQDNGGTAIRVGAGGTGESVMTILRVDGDATHGKAGASDSGANGFSIKYDGSDSYPDNKLIIKADNGNPTQGGTVSGAYQYYRIRAVNADGSDNNDQIGIGDINLIDNSNGTSYPTSVFLSSDYPGGNYPNDDNGGTNKLGPFTIGGVQVSSGYVHSGTYGAWRVLDDITNNLFWTLNNYSDTPQRTAATNYLDIKLTGGAIELEKIQISVNRTHHHATRLLITAADNANFNNAIEWALIDYQSATNITALNFNSIDVFPGTTVTVASDGTTSSSSSFEAPDQVVAQSVLQDGRVGIATDSPERALHIKTTSDSVLTTYQKEHPFMVEGSGADGDTGHAIIELRGGKSTSKAGIDFGDNTNTTESGGQIVTDINNGGSGPGGIIYENEHNKMRIKTNGTDSITINSDGRVGLNGQLPENAYHNSGGNGANDLVIGNTSETAGMTIRSANNGKGNIFFADSDHNFPGMISYDHVHNRMDISCNSEGYPDGGQVFNGIQIDSSGKVGIQLTDSTPEVSLHVNGPIKSEEFVQFGSYTTTERDALTGVNGMVIYNTTLNKFEGYQDGGWVSFVTS